MHHGHMGIGSEGGQFWWWSSVRKTVLAITGS